MYLSKLPTPHHLTHLRATSFDNGAETPLPYFPEQEQAVLSAKEAYAATRMLYTRAHAKLQAVLAQMPDGFEQGQPPSKGVAKPDPVLLEQLDTLEPQVREQSKLLEGAKFQLRLAERSLAAAQNRAFIKIQTDRNVQMSRSMATTYSNVQLESSEALGAGRAKLVKERRDARLAEAIERRRRQRKLNAMSFDTNVEDFAQGWRGSWEGGKLFPPVSRFPPTKWLPPPPPPASEPEAVTALKKHLGQNLGRVTDLFKKWDVDCDHTVSMEELRNAFGALRVPIDDASLNALFNDLDADQSGTLDFDELHKALRKEPPRRVPADQICLTLPRRKEPNVLGTGAERRALAALKRAVHVHLDRTTDLFHQMDYDGDGLISKQELKRALAAQCIEVDRVALDSLFAKLDADNSGGVDFKEMHRMLRREFTFVDELADARLVNGPASGGATGPSPSRGPAGAGGGGLVTSASVPALRGDGAPRARTVPAGAVRSGGAPSRAHGATGRSATPGNALAPSPSRRVLYEQKLQRHDHSIVNEIFMEREAQGATRAPPAAAGGKAAAQRGMPHSRTEPRLAPSRKLGS